MPSVLGRGGRALALRLGFLLLVLIVGGIVRLPIDPRRLALVDRSEARSSSRSSPPLSDGHSVGGGADRGKTVAIAYITRAPLLPATLERIYAFSAEMGGWGGLGSEEGSSGYAYELVVVVDETSVRGGTSELVRRYYERRWRRERRRSGVAANVAPPLVFPTSEIAIFEAYPKLSNYRWNGPDELNTNNQTGECCGLPIMWQMLAPSIALLMHRHPRFDFVWRIEHDINSVGEDSLLGLARRWDDALEDGGGGGRAAAAAEVVDLAGEITTSNNVPKNVWVRHRHTPKFDDILGAMGGGVPDGELRRWRCYTDAVQRYSRRFASYLHRRIEDNVFQFGECFVQPMAWSGNFTVRELSGLLARTAGVSVRGLDGLTGEKISREEARRRFESMAAAGGNATFLYHEEPPPVPLSARIQPSAWARSWRAYTQDMRHLCKYEKNAAFTVFLSGSVLGAFLGVLVERRRTRRISFYP